MKLKARVEKLELIIKPDQVPMIHYVYLDENGQVSSMDIPEAEFRAGQESGKYPAQADLIEIICEANNEKNKFA